MGGLAVPPFAFPRLALALWLVCGVVGPSPLLAEVPVCYSPPLLAGFRCRWWWAVPATPGWGPLAAVVCGVWCVVCGVWRWCVGGVVAGVWCGWSLATPGGGSCVLLPATPGWVSLPVVVRGPRHSWLGSVGGVAVCCVVCGGGVLVGLWLVCGVVGPSPLLAEVPVCYSPPLLAGFRCRWWWAVPATPGWGPLAAVVCGVWCVVCGGGVLVGLWLVCGVVGPSPLLAEVPVCYSPPLLAGFRCRWWWAVPATPGWGPLAAVVCGVWCVVCGGGVLLGLWLVCGVVGPSPLLAEVPVCYSPPLLAGFRCRWWWEVPATRGWGPLAAVVCGVLCSVCGVLVGSLATPGGGSCVLLPATPGWVSLLLVVGGPRHSWLGSAGGGGVWCVVCGGGVLVGLLLGAHSSIRTAAGVRVCSCACFAWPGRAGRPPGRVLVRLTFSFGRFVFLLCLAPSGLGLPPSLSLLLPFLVGCFSRPPAAWLSVRSRLVCVSRLAVGCPLVFAPPPPSSFVSRGIRRSCLVPWCFPLCAPVVSGFLWFAAPGAPGLGACVVYFVGLPLLGSPCACPSFVLSAWLLAAPAWLVPPPHSPCLAVFVPAARCCVPCCAVRPWVRCCAALLRVVSPGVVLSCAVLRSLVWMWPIKLNVRSTWQAERGRRTKKTAMLLNTGKSSFLACHHRFVQPDLRSGDRACAGPYCRHMYLEPRRAPALVHHQVSRVLRLVLQRVYCHVWVVRHPRSHQQGGATGEPTGFGLACPHLHYYPLSPELRLPRRLGALVVRGHQPQRRQCVGPGAQGLWPCHVDVRLLVLAFREYVAEDVHEGCWRVVRRPPRGGG